MNFGLILAVPAGLIAAVITWRTYGWFAETRATAFRQTPFDRFTARLVAATAIGIAAGIYVERSINPEDPGGQPATARAASASQASPRQAISRNAALPVASPTAAPTAAPVPVPEMRGPSAALADEVDGSASTASPAVHPRIACGDKAVPIERLLCADPELSALEARVSDTYARALATLDRAADRDALQRAQAAWRRDGLLACTTADCANKTYQSRIDDLSGAFGIQLPGDTRD